MRCLLALVMTLAVTGLAYADEVIPAAKSPEAAKQSMRVAPGYRVDLVAHEPLTMDPVAFDWGPDGKLWVAEMADYPNGIDGKGTPGGRIRYLEDTDGDGQYDKTTLFLEGVPFPNGVIAWKKGVLVSAAPDIFYAEDTDGDGKADVKHVLFTGFAEGNQQHRANGFSRGLDNWLYLANGDSGGTVACVQSLNKALASGPQPSTLDPQPKIDIRGRDIRIRPDTGEIEAVVGQSQFGRNRDDWGNWFGNNNSRPMYHYVLDDEKIPVPAADIDRDWIAETVNEVAAAIAGQGFEPTPSVTACGYCDFRIACPAAEL